MSAIVKSQSVDIAGVESVLISGDMSNLSSEQRVSYYARVCESVGLNPLTQPFEYIRLNGKLVFYAKRACTDQLRQVHKVSINIVAREKVEDVYVVTARATTPDGRTDESIGAVPVASLKGENYANALMKAETKAKRRVTLAICGLAVLDETELEGVPQAERVSFGDHAPSAPRAKALPLEASRAIAAAEAQGFVPETDFDLDALMVVDLPQCRTEEQLVHWFREVLTLNLSPADKKAAWERFSDQCAENEVHPKEALKKAQALAKEQSK